MASTCLRLKRLLLGRWLAAAPAVPTLRLSSDASSITALFDYAPPTPFNEGDTLELQLYPTEAKLLAALGDALDWCTFYEGTARRYTVDRLPAERAFRVRARARNARGVSAWTPEQRVATKQVPTRCGGTGPGYTWDQTPEEVELFVRVPAGVTPRELLVDVKPRRIRVAARGALLLEAPLGGEVRAADAGDFEWALQDDVRGGDAEDAAPQRVLAITLAKREVSYDPAAQWCCALLGEQHPQVDTGRLSWTRERPWRPPQDARNLEEVAKALPGNVVHARPTNNAPAQDPAAALGNWGGQWRGAKHD